MIHRVPYGGSFVDPDFMQLFQAKYHILDTLLLYDYDDRFDALHQHLALLRRDHFHAQDKIIVAHFDTDYYVHNQFGINLTNLFAVWQSADIPLHVMLLYTNHFGIGREIDMICCHQPQADRPTVVETLLEPTNYSRSTYDLEPDLALEAIDHHGMAMMGRARSHRFALYNHLSHLADKLALTIKAHP